MSHHQNPRGFAHSTNWNPQAMNDEIKEKKSDRNNDGTIESNIDNNSIDNSAENIIIDEWGFVVDFEENDKK